MSPEDVAALTKLAARAERGQLGPARRFVAQASEEQGRAAEASKPAVKKAEGATPVVPVAVVSPLAAAAPVAAPASAAASLSVAAPVPMAAPAPVSVRAPVSAPAPISVRAPVPAPAELPEPDLNTTAPGVLIPRGLALPFRPAGPEGPSPSKAPAPPPAPPASEPATGTSTGPLTDVPRGPALPFRSSEPAPAPAPQLTLSQYASLCAELALAPASADAIFRRYGLESAEQRSAADAAWKERFRREPSKYQAWQDLYRRWYAHWAARGAQAG